MVILKGKTKSCLLIVLLPVQHAHSILSVLSDLCLCHITKCSVSQSHSLRLPLDAVYKPHVWCVLSWCPDAVSVPVIWHHVGYMQQWAAAAGCCCCWCWMCLCVCWLSTSDAVCPLCAAISPTLCRPFTAAARIACKYTADQCRLMLLISAEVVWLSDLSSASTTLAGECSSISLL